MSAQLGLRLLEILVPQGRLALSLIEAYYDESDSTSEPNLPQVLCVGGYLFDSDAARALESEWKPLLQKYGLTYFHMASCNSQWGEFEQYTDDECVVIQTEFFEVLKRRARRGFAASVELRHKDLLPSYLRQGIEIISPYALLCYWCLEHARAWTKMEGLEAQFAYFFESGYEKQSEVAKIMRDMFSDPIIKKKYLWGSDAFVPKEKAVLLQTADIIAWQWRRSQTLRLAGKTKPRGDFLSLLEIPTDSVHFDEEKIRAFIEQIRESRLRHDVTSGSSPSAGRPA